MTQKLRLLIFLFLPILAFSAFSQKAYETASYPDEAGFQLRIKKALPMMAEKGFGIISKSLSKCPDTGLPVYTYAIEGEEIISPYTGRKYKQPATGYFSAKSRNEKGEITGFGGDPLKYDLPRAMASILTGVRTNEAKAYLSIPGNLKQQYHFACKHWTRFYPLLADSMGNEWKQKFQGYVANYTEEKRVTDDLKGWLNLSTPHNLIGQQDQLLGGHPIEGGTENHKIMWRTSGLLYAQLFPDTAKVSKVPAPQARLITKEILRLFLKKLLITGNGEYDSGIYYPHCIEGFMNLYDFSPDPETRLLAKFALDYYFATYGLKTIDGVIAGSQKRGYLAKSKQNEMQKMLWAYVGETAIKNADDDISIYLATTTYRPNKVIMNIIQKKLATPFESKMSRPFYQMDKGMAFAESFYCSKNYAMGNIQNSIVDNPNQQLIWSLVTKGELHPYCFSGSQPLRGSNSGHSPYTQTFQSKGTIIVMTAGTEFTQKVDTTNPPTPAGFERANYWLLPFSEQPANYEMSARQKYAYKPLNDIAIPAKISDGLILNDFWEKSKQAACTWFVFPKEIKVVLLEGNFYFETPNTWVALIPFDSSKCHEVITTKETIIASHNGDAKKLFDDYNLICSFGQVSGYIVETAEKSSFASINEWNAYLQKSTKLTFSAQTRKVNYTSAYGEKIEMQYQSDKLRPSVNLNKKHINFDKYTNGAVYSSPYLNIKNGIMKVSDGVSSFTVDFTGKLPKYK